jgi:hypothetical protein
MAHASLCETAVGRAFFPVLKDMVEVCLDPFMDHRIWEVPGFRKLLLDPGQGRQVSIVGMKGMPGTVNYSGENQFGPYPDPGLNELRDMIGADAEDYAGFHDPTVAAPVIPLPVTPPSTAPSPPGPAAIAVVGGVNRRLTVDVHLICFNEEAIMAYAMRHYASFATRIFLHDAHSTDRSREIARSFGAEIVDWNCSELIDDLELTAVKNECWPGSTANFVVVADVDEFLYFPRGTHGTLEAYLRQNLAVAKPTGYEMITCHFPWQIENDPYPTGGGQIYDEVQYGAKDDMWYAKPVLFSPKLVKESGIGIGGHGASLVLHDGRTVEVDRSYPKSQPPCYLLHYHQIGPITRIAAGYDAKLAKMCQHNRDAHWGNHEPGLKHAQDKRAFILTHLERVIP